MDNTGSPSTVEEYTDLDVPPLPRGLPEVLAPLHGSGVVGPDAISAAVDAEPYLERRILNQINGRLRRPVDDLERGVQMVGPITAAGLIVELSMRQWSTLLEGPAAPCLARLVCHSEATGALAQRLLTNQPDEDAEPDQNQPDQGRKMSFRWKGFTMGLFHDLGKLVLIHNYPETAAALYDRHQAGQEYGNANPRVRERATFGCDHTEAGAWAAETLGLTESLATVAGQHHDDEVIEASRDVRAAQVANLLTKTMGPEFAGLSATEVTLDWEACTRDPVWTDWAQNESGPDLKALRKQFMQKSVLYTQFVLDLPGVESFSD